MDSHLLSTLLLGNRVCTLPLDSSQLTPITVLFSYTNVYHACRAAHKSVLHPLLFLLPFPTTVLLQAFWLLAPGSPIVHSSLFVPFLCAWGLQFAHQVGRVILAHVTGSQFPYWNWLWVWFAVGAIDANAPRIFGV